MSEKIKYQKGILPNLLSGFYEQVELEKKDESHRTIFQELRKEFWQQQNQGAKAELEREIGFLMALQEMDLDDKRNNISEEICKFIEIEMKYLNKRLKELEGVTKQ